MGVALTEWLLHKQTLEGSIFLNINEQKTI